MTEDAAPPLRKKFTIPIELADLELATGRASHQLNVFVAGPYIQRDWSTQQRATVERAAILRIEIIEYIENTLRHRPVLGEHRGVEEIGEIRLGTKASPVAVEMQLVKKTCQAVVIIPSSPGSFSELGSWSLMEGVCRKMLILADSNYAKAIGYINNGVYKMATDNGATLHWVDYTARDTIFQFVAEHVGRIEDSEAIRRIIHDE
jgi:hypothetical protein